MTSFLAVADDLNRVSVPLRDLDVVDGFVDLSEVPIEHLELVRSQLRESFVPEVLLEVDEELAAGVRADLAAAEMEENLGADDDEEAVDGREEDE